MATYYVRNDGNNANTGLGPNANQAWQTIQYALRVGSPVTGGDIIYIAPGRYYELVKIGISTPASEVQILGDPTCQRFTDLAPGIIRWTNLPSDSSGGQQSVILLTNATPNLTFRFIYFDIWSRFTTQTFSTGGNTIFERCVIAYGGNSANLAFSIPSTHPNFRFSNNIVIGTAYIIFGSGAGTFDANYYIVNNIFVNLAGAGTRVQVQGTCGGGVFYNNTLLGGALSSTGTNTTNPWKVYNNVLWGGVAESMRTDTLGGLVGDYNRVASEAGVYQYVAGTNDQLQFQACQFSFGADRLFGIGTNDFFAPYTNAAITNAGQPDSNVVTITAGTAEIPQGGVVYKVGDSMVFTSTVGNLLAGTIFKVATVTSTTSFTLTGITPNVSGTVIHRRIRPTVDMYDAPNQFTNVGNKGALVKYALSTIGQYLPQERQSTAVRLVPGSTSNSLTVFLGATGLVFNTPNLVARYIRNNGASVSVPLVSQTIGGAWVAGGFCEIDPVNLPGFYRFDLPNEAIDNYTTALGIAIKGAVGTNGAYITAELEQSTTLISTTGYKLISDQLGANGALDVIKGSSITVKLQITDVNQKPVPIGSATCTVQVYSLNNLVATYPVVIQYQSNGEMTFVLDTAVTTAPGSYNIYVNRNNGGSDTVVYGPMKLTVSNL